MMERVTFGTMPADFPTEPFKPYRLGNLSSEDWDMLANCINEGIDSHLEAISYHVKQERTGRRSIIIEDAVSMRCLVRRLLEWKPDTDPTWNEETRYYENERGENFASAIVGTLELEWV
jgi:hypothetical protein